jgi:hypothetical protein
MERFTEMQSEQETVIQGFFCRLLAKVVFLNLLKAASPPPRTAAGALMQEI